MTQGPLFPHPKWTARLKPARPHEHLDNHSLVGICPASPDAADRACVWSTEQVALTPGVSQWVVGAVGRTTRDPRAGLAHQLTTPREEHAIYFVPKVHSNAR